MTPHRHAHAVRSSGRSTAPSPEREDASLSAFTAVLCLSLFLLLGLVVDAGRAVSARAAAMTTAEEAARLGAGQLSVGALRSGQIDIDPAAAVRAADAYVRSAGETGTTTVSGQTVTVHVSTTEPTVILGIIDIRTIVVDASASATNLHGVTEED